MKVFIDSNVLFSAALFPGSTPARALYKALTEPNDAIVCEINIDELKKVFKRKMPEKISVLNTFLSMLMTAVTIVKVPELEIADEQKIRDEKDRPIFRAAVASGADVILTGDKDFLESGITDPRIVSPGEFLK